MNLLKVFNARQLKSKMAKAAVVASVMASVFGVNVVQAAHGNDYTGAVYLTSSTENTKDGVKITFGTTSLTLHPEKTGQNYYVDKTSYYTEDGKYYIKAYTDSDKKTVANTYEMTDVTAWENMRDACNGTVATKYKWLEVSTSTADSSFASGIVNNVYNDIKAEISSGKSKNIIIKGTGTEKDPYVLDAKLDITKIKAGNNIKVDYSEKVDDGVTTTREYTIGLDLKDEDFKTLIENYYNNNKEVVDNLFKGEKGDKGDKGDQGIQGIDGKDGKDGIDGKDGLNGIDGVDGKSVTVEQTDNGAKITDGNGNVVEVLNGKDGKGFAGDITGDNYITVNKDITQEGDVNYTISGDKIINYVDEQDTKVFNKVNEVNNYINENEEKWLKDNDTITTVKAKDGSLISVEDDKNHNYTIDDSKLQKTIADGDTKVLNESKTYTDNRIGDIDKSITVKQYVDQQDEKVFNKAVEVANNYTDSRIGEVNDRIDKTGASLSALAGLHYQPMRPGDSQIAAAVGHYKGKTALALGGAYQFNNRVAGTIGGTMQGKDLMFNVGVSYVFGGHTVRDKVDFANTEAHPKQNGVTLVEAELMAMNDSLHHKNALLKDKVMEQDAKIAKLEAELAEIKAMLLKK